MLLNPELKGSYWGNMSKIDFEIRYVQRRGSVWHYQRIVPPDVYAKIGGPIRRGVTGWR